MATKNHILCEILKEKNIPSIEEIKNKTGIPTNFLLFLKLIRIVTLANENNVVYLTNNYIINALVIISKLVSSSFICDVNLYYNVLKKKQEKFRDYYNFNEENLDNKQFNYIKNLFIKFDLALVTLYDDGEKSKDNVYLLDKLIEEMVYKLKNFPLIHITFDACPELFKIPLFTDKIFIKKLVYYYIFTVLNSDNINDIIYFQRVVEYFFQNVKFPFDEVMKSELVEFINEELIKLNSTDKQKCMFLEQLFYQLHSVKLSALETLETLKSKFKIGSPHIGKIKLIEKPEIKYIDLRKRYTITIDNPNQINYDDAFSFFKMKDGKYIFSLYITDINSFVPENSKLDLYAANIGETLYSFDINKPNLNMMPSKYSINKFSLFQNKERYVQVFEYELSNDFDILSSKIYNGYIKVNKNFTYEEIDEIFMYHDFEYYEYFKALREFINKLKSLGYATLLDSNILHNNMLDDYSSLSFEMIAQIKLMNNHNWAHYFKTNNLPLIYLNDDYKLMNNMLETLNGIIPDKGKYDDLKVVFKNFMNQSTYDVKCMGHFGLNLDSYALITTPLRNFVSLTNQRAIQSLIIEGDITDKNIYKYEELLTRVAKEQQKKKVLNKYFVNGYGKI